MLKVLVGCESSGIVRDAFSAKGHFAMSCDLLPSERPGFHYRGDVRDLFNLGWDLMVIHPDCTYVCGSGWHWNRRVVGRHMMSLRAIAFFAECMNAPIPHIAAENPVGVLSRYYRKPDQYIQPHEYGHDASKKTGLWLKNLPLLRGTSDCPPRIVEYPIGSGKMVGRWSNQTDSGQNKLPPSENRWKDRSRTYQGWADAMADQWTRSIEGC